jgi:hypothetical protein
MVGKTLNDRARGERLQRATSIRAIALRLIQEKGRWEIVCGRLEIETKTFEDDRFLMMFYVMPPVPVEMRRQFGIGPLHFGLYALELWDRRVGKVLNLFWDSVGAPPRIVTFRRGEWEELLPRSSAPLR